MSESFPTEADFLDVDRGPIPQEAWKNFGGLSLDEAYGKFCDRPYLYSQDFTFMGESAFAYYFEVLDRYVRKAIETLDEERLMVLGAIHQIIDMHFVYGVELMSLKDYRQTDVVNGVSLPQRVVGLCDHVLRAIGQLSLASHIPDSDATNEELTIAWQGLRNLADSRLSRLS